MNLYPITIENNDMILNKVHIHEMNFKSLNLKECNVEEFVRKNSNDIFGDEESFIIIGQQVINSENGRSDLVAVDEDGSLVLIEIKRDEEDIKGRKEPFEFQAIRYAANFAKIKNIDEVCESVYCHYIEKYASEYNLDNISPLELAKRTLFEFLKENNSMKEFNKKQRIILIASSFDKQTLSAVAWLIENGVDICCYTINPVEINEQIYINMEKKLPVPSIDEFYVGIKSRDDKPILTSTTNRKARNSSLPKMQRLFDEQCISQGDLICIRRGFNKEENIAEIIDSKYVKYKNEVLTINEWAKAVTGWGVVNIYENTILLKEGKTLHEIRLGLED